jgi:hypothetical protein
MTIAGASNVATSRKIWRNAATRNERRGRALDELNTGGLSCSWSEVTRGGRPTRADVTPKNAIQPGEKGRALGVGTVVPKSRDCKGYEYL